MNILEVLESNPQLYSKELAVAIGLNEAVVVQQIHYWLKKSKHYKDGRFWTYNTLHEWLTENFPFFSYRTLQRVLLDLEEKGILMVRNYNLISSNKTKWYSINYDVLMNFVASVAVVATTPVATVAVANVESEKNREIILDENIAKMLKDHDELEQATTKTPENHEKSYPQESVHNIVNNLYTPVNPLVPKWHVQKGYPHGVYKNSGQKSPVNPLVPKWHEPNPLVPKWHVHSAKLAPSITETSSETSKAEISERRESERGGVIRDYLIGKKPVDKQGIADMIAAAKKACLDSAAASKKEVARQLDLRRERRLTNEPNATPRA